MRPHDCIECGAPVQHSPPGWGRYEYCPLCIAEHHRRAAQLRAERKRIVAMRPHHPISPEPYARPVHRYVGP